MISVFYTLYLSVLLLSPMPNILSEKVNNTAYRKSEKEVVTGDFYFVTASRAYFHSAPSYSYRYSNKFLVYGDYCEVLRYKNGFGYVNYYNPKVNKTTSGWLDMDNLESDQD